MENIQFKRNELLASKLIANFEKRNFNAYYCPNNDALIVKIQELINKEEETVSWGGSMTLEESGVKTFLIKDGYKIINRDNAKLLKKKKSLLNRVYSVTYF